MQQPIFGFFGDLEQARRAVDRVTASGVAPTAVTVHVAPAPASAAAEHVGSFADSGPHQHTPERDHVGSFADSGPHQHTPERDHVGSFADSGPHQHTPERDHVGTFAQTERSAGLMRQLEHELRAAGLSDEAAREAATRVTGGSVLVVVQATSEQAPEVTASLAS